MMRMLATAMAALFASAPALAHETWLVPLDASVQAGRRVTLETSSGMDFPAPGSAIEPERVAVANWRTGTATGVLGTLKRGAQRSQFSFAPPAGTSGLLVAWMSLKPRTIQLTDAQIDEYMDEIGATPELRAQAQAAKGAGRWTEIYAKHAKAFLRVGDGGGAGWEVPVGAPLELVPLADPTMVKPGESLSVRVLLKGAPVAGLPVGRMREGSKARAYAVSGADGVVRVPLDAAGRWLLYTVHLVREPGPSRWRSEFATLAFALR